MFQSIIKYYIFSQGVLKLSTYPNSEWRWACRERGGTPQTTRTATLVWKPEKRVQIKSQRERERERER